MLKIAMQIISLTGTIVLMDAAMAQPPASRVSQGAYRTGGVYKEGGKTTVVVPGVDDYVMLEDTITTSVDGNGGHQSKRTHRGIITFTGGTTQPHTIISRNNRPEKLQAEQRKMADFIARKEQTAAMSPGARAAQRPGEVKSYQDERGNNVNRHIGRLGTLQDLP